MALLEIARPLSRTLTLMSPGSCCMCGLPVRDHTKHLCVEKTKKLVSPKSPVIKQSNENQQVSPPNKTTPAAGALSFKQKQELGELGAAGEPRTLAVTQSGIVKPTLPNMGGIVQTSSSVTLTNLSNSNIDVTPDVQLWLNTLSRSPNINNTLSRSPIVNKPTVTTKAETTSTPLAAVVKTVAQHSLAPQTSEPLLSDREHKQAVSNDTDTEKMLSKIADRQISLKDRLNVVRKRLFRYKTNALMKHVISQLDKFDRHSLATQVEPQQQLPCQHKLEYRPVCPTRPAPSLDNSCESEPPMDGHAFSTMEKLRVTVGEELLQETSGMLSHYDDENTESSSDEEDLDTISEQSFDRTELSLIEQRWEQERAQIAAQWTWIRGQYEDLQHRMRRESDLLQVIRDKKDKVVLLHNDHCLNDHVSDKFAHHPAMVPPLNGYHHTHPSLMMKNNFKFDMSRTGQEMYLKSNQHKRLNKNSKIDGNTCARTRPLACMIRRNVVSGKPNQRCIVQRTVPLRASILGKQCCRKTTSYSNDKSRQDPSYHPVLSRRTETHINVHLSPLLSGVDYFPAERKQHPLPPHPAAPSTPDQVQEQPSPRPVLTTSLSSPVTTNITTPVEIHQEPSTSTSFLFPELSPLATSDSAPKKRSSPAATVEHMIKKYRTSQPGSRATSPVHMDKRKKPNQFDIHNIEVDFSVVAPARIEKPRYKEIEIPKFRLITDDILNELLVSEKASPEDDSAEGYESLHSRCEELEKVRFINMQINATGGMRGHHADLSQNLLYVSDTNHPPTDNSHKPHTSRQPSSEKQRTISIVNCKTLNMDSDKKGEVSERSRAAPAARKNDKHMSYLEDEIRRTRASKHTSDYPTAVS